MVASMLLVILIPHCWIFFQVFRPDRFNGFDVCSEVEARTEQQRNQPKKVSARMRYVAHSKRRSRNERGIE